MRLKNLLLATLALIFLAGTASAQSQPQTSQYTPKETPSFFPVGIQQSTDPVQQRVEYEHIFQGTWGCNQGSGSNARMDLDPTGSYKVTTDVVSTSSVTENPAHMTIVLDHHFKLPDGRIRVTSMCGQEFISQEELDRRVNSLKNLAVIAAKNDDAFYQKILARAVSARAAKLGISEKELVAQLDEKVPGYDITFRELHRLPKPSKYTDFIPRELHLGYNPPLQGILGVTWLNTGVIYYNPNAWMVDYVLTKPVIMQHEMVHGNINVEKFPMSEAFDVELMADMPIVLYPENTVNFQSHGYAKDLREFAEIYFGFDWDQYENDVVKFNFEGNVVYDDEKYVYYYKQLAQVKAEMLKFFEEVTIPEFYSDPVWWAAVNDIRGDNNSVFRMTLALHYNPTILGGAAKTMDWLNAHSEEIKEIAGQAFNAGMGKQGGGDMGGMNTANIPPALVEEYNRMFTPIERANIEAYFKQHPEQLKELVHMSPTELAQFLSTFKGSVPKGAVQQ